MGKPICYMMCGMPGSGKSTYIEEHLMKRHKSIVIISRDIIRHELGFTKSSDEKAVLNFHEERTVTEHERNKIAECCERGDVFVIDDTNTIPKYRKSLIRFLKEHGCKIVAVNITCDLNICIANRNGQIPPDNMRKMYNQLKYISKDEGVDSVIWHDSTNDMK